MSEAVTPEAEAAWAERSYECPAHDECSGPTGVLRPFTCSVCKVEVNRDTCWARGQRVASVTPVLCGECSGQGVLL